MTTTNDETAAAIDPPRPDAVRVALEERTHRLTRDVRDIERLLQRLHEQQDSVTRDLLEAQAQLTATTTALAALDAKPAPPLDTWDEVATAFNSLPGGMVFRPLGVADVAAILVRGSAGRDPWTPNQVAHCASDYGVHLPVEVIATW